MSTAKSDPLLLRATAIDHGVCVQPVMRQVEDTTTGEITIVPLACGSTRESQCPPCAESARRLRIHQCREGWHRTDDPVTADVDGDGDQADDKRGRLEDEDASGEVSGSTDDADTADDADGDDELVPVRRRSTARRDDFPALPPKQPMAERTVGRVYRGTDGRSYQPSMFITLTLPSYGKVHRDPNEPTMLGTPTRPDAYDYRRAALDAIHFPRLVDRWVQNVRRCAGYKVQYFATVEPQKRLAPHLHVAMRGTIPRRLLRAITAATYEQIWWPAHDPDRPVYTGDRLPVWDETALVPAAGENALVSGAYVEPDTGLPLLTWEEAIQATYEPDAQPVHVLSFGNQMDMQGLLPGTKQTDRRIGYLTKYVTKSISEAYDPAAISDAQRAHVRRLHDELRWLPCSPECDNWLRYGIHPKDFVDGMEPGQCPRPAHRLDDLGYGGRRVLVSRQWTGKTLAEHKADRAEVIRQTLAVAGVDMADLDRLSADVLDDDGEPRYRWRPLTDQDEQPTYKQMILTAIEQKRRWRDQYDTAKHDAQPPDEPCSATNQTAAPVAA